MEKQGERYLKLISLSLAAIFALFLLLRLFGGSSGYRLQEVTYCQVGDGISVSGFVVREERILYTSEQNLMFLVREGQWLKGGQAYAAAYGSDRSPPRENAAERDPAEVMTELSLARHSGQLPTKEISEAFLFSNASSTFEAAQEAPLAYLCTASAGYFSQKADGYETLLTPEALQSMEAADFASLTALSPREPREAAGKLILGQSWYFAALAEEGGMEESAVGTTLTLRFTGDFCQDVSMELLRLSSPWQGKQLAVFRCSRGLHALTAPRRLNASILFDTTEGLLVPTEALYLIEGQTGVYVLVGARAKWKEVTILARSEEAVIVEYDPSDTAHLRPEDELIISTEEIENGKVIQ